MENQKKMNLSEAKGVIEYTFLNDYMFRAILQKNEKVLKALIAACLYKEIGEIEKVCITNPIVLGEAIDDKTFILDVNVVLNNNHCINLEMQVANFGDWPERSLSYLCRNYDNLCKGASYEEVKSAYHIGFLDFDLFPEYQEFFSKYRMMNIKNHSIFSSKFNLYVVNLNQIEAATKYDYESGLVYWTKLFKAKTWEEIKMMVQNQPELKTASEVLYELNQDEIVRQQCRAREDYYARERYVKHKIEEQQERIEEQQERIEEQQERIEEQQERIEEQQERLEIMELQQKIEREKAASKLAQFQNISFEKAYELLFS